MLAWWLTSIEEGWYTLGAQFAGKGDETRLQLVERGFPLAKNGQIISEVISEVMSETSHTEEVDLDHVRMRECVWT